MFIKFLALTFALSLIVSAIVSAMFSAPIGGVLRRIISEDISEAWLKYVKFAMYVVGISSGIRLWQLERYVNARDDEKARILELTQDRWIFEVYRTIIETVQGLTWLLLGFFVFALLIYIVVRALEALRLPKVDDRASVPPPAGIAGSGLPRRVETVER